MHQPGTEGSCQELTNNWDSRDPETKFNRRKEWVWNEDLGFSGSAWETLPYMAKTFQVWLNSSLELISKDYPRGQISITSVLMRRRQREITKRRGEDDITMEAEFGVMQPRAKEFKLPPHRYRLYPRYSLYLLIKGFKLQGQISGLLMAELGYESSSKIFLPFGKETSPK